MEKYFISQERVISISDNNVFVEKPSKSREVTKEEYENCEREDGINKHIEIDGKWFNPEQKESWEKHHQEFEKELPGYLEFLDKLQVGKRIKFNGLKFRNEKSPPDFKQDTTIEIVFREERGFMGRCPGCGCIEYANVKEDGSGFTECHSGGYFPCQTFTSMRGWYRASDSYEVLN